MYLKYYLFLVLFCSSLPILAQKMQLSINLNDVKKGNHNIYSNGNVLLDKIKVLAIHPTVGFFYLPNKNIGLGIQIGYWKVVQKENINLTGPSSNEYQTINYHSATKVFSIQFIVQEYYYYGKYILNSAISLPFNYIPTGKGILDQYVIAIPTNTINNSANQIEILPHILDWGLYYKPTISRQVYKNLYLSASLSLGFAREEKFGIGYNSVVFYDHGSKTSDFNYNTKYKKSSTTTFNTFPSFSLIYNIK